jgi:N-acetylneuraminate synthase
MNPVIHINGRAIGTEHPPYVIAELSANHNGKLETALSIVEEAHIAGAAAVKLQADTITLNSQSEDCIRGGLWDGRSLYELYEKPTCPGTGTNLV